MNPRDSSYQETDIQSRLGAVLFDLDGTLVDTAPGMAQALNRLLASQGLASLPYPVIRPHVSGGTRALLKLATQETGVSFADPTWNCSFLEHYAVTMTHGLDFFSGIVELLAQLHAWSVPWGIVTNKPQHLAERVMDFLLPALDGRVASPCCLVGGGNTFKPKPDPAGILHALVCCDALSQQAVMVGDDQRDIAAGHAAGIHTLAVTYGYIPPHEQPSGWGAHALCASPLAVLDYLATLRAQQPSWQTARA